MALAATQQRCDVHEQDDQRAGQSRDVAGARGDAGGRRSGDRRHRDRNAHGGTRSRLERDHPGHACGQRHAHRSDAEGGQSADETRVERGPREQSDRTERERQQAGGDGRQTEADGERHQRAPDERPAPADDADARGDDRQEVRAHRHRADDEDGIAQDDPVAGDRAGDDHQDRIQGDHARHRPGGSEQLGPHQRVAVDAGRSDGGDPVPAPDPHRVGWHARPLETHECRIDGGRVDVRRDPDGAADGRHEGDVRHAVDGIERSNALVGHVRVGVGAKLEHRAGLPGLSEDGRPIVPAADDHPTAGVRCRAHASPRTMQRNPRWAIEVSTVCA